MTEFGSQSKLRLSNFPLNLLHIDRPIAIHCSTVLSCDNYDNVVDYQQKP